MLVCIYTSFTITGSTVFLTASIGEAWPAISVGLAGAAICFVGVFGLLTTYVRIVKAKTRKGPHKKKMKKEEENGV